jgi:hypothetical protein
MRGALIWCPLFVAIMLVATRYVLPPPERVPGYGECVSRGVRPPPTLVELIEREGVSYDEFEASWYRGGNNHLAFNVEQAYKNFCYRKEGCTDSNPVSRYWQPKEWPADIRAGIDRWRGGGSN